jgi:hypothetical protein
VNKQRQSRPTKLEFQFAFLSFNLAKQGWWRRTTQKKGESFEDNRSFPLRLMRETSLREKPRGEVVSQQILGSGGYP